MCFAIAFCKIIIFAVSAIVHQHTCLDYVHKMFGIEVEPMCVLLFLMRIPLGQCGFLEDWTKSHFNIFYNAPKTWHEYVRGYLFDSLRFPISVHHAALTWFLSNQLADMTKFKEVNRSVLLFSRLVSLLKTKLNCSFSNQTKHESQNTYHIGTVVTFPVGDLILDSDLQPSVQLSCQMHCKNGFMA